MLGAALPLLVALTLAPQQDAPTADELVADGWRLLPEYTGDHRPSLGAAAGAWAQAAVHLFEAALALDPGHVRAHWSLGHGATLLACDATSRGLATADGHVETARGALEGAMELSPGDPWNAYALGVLEVHGGAPAAGEGHLGEAVRWLDARAGTGSATDSDPWLRFKALEWRGEALMRAGRFEEARAAQGAFHGEFSTNAFPLGVARAESYLRERDLAGARREFEALTEAFPDDFQAHASLGYLAGLRQDDDAAAAHLAHALQIEPLPGLYLRLWRWILAPDPLRAEARAELDEFVSDAPPSLSPWDARLGTFVLGGSTQEEFIAAARAEVGRRLEAGEDVDHLLTEAWFYVGVRHAEDARGLQGEAREAALGRARAAHREALRSRPIAWKWEWAFARLFHARLARDAGQGTTAAAPGPEGTVVIGIHIPGSDRPVPGSAAPVPVGSALLERVPDGSGGLRFRVRPVLASD